MVDRALGDKSFLQRIEREFSPDQMTSSNIEEFLFSSKKRSPHEVKWGKTRSGKQRYKEVPGAPISSGTRRLSEELSKTEEVLTEIQVSKKEIELERIKIKAEELPVHSDTLIKDADVKINKVRKERLVKKGKTTTIFRNELREASSEEEIDRILGESFTELGSGKNYDSLIEVSEILKDRL